jgi:hypothetical protein
MLEIVLLAAAFFGASGLTYSKTSFGTGISFFHAKTWKAAPFLTSKLSAAFLSTFYFLPLFSSPFSVGWSRGRSNIDFNIAIHLESIATPVPVPVPDID